MFLLINLDPFQKNERAFSWRREQRTVSKTFVFLPMKCIQPTVSLMLGICHLTLPVLCLRPNPPIQTAVQTAVYSRKAVLAAQLSSNATPALLAHLGSNRSRKLLEVDCPTLANATVEQILNRLLAELEVSELVQSLGSGLYQTLPQLFEPDFLYNIW